jgi:DUF1680 family protein
VVKRTWKKGDLVEFITPMEVREIVSRPEVKQNAGRLALQYGPLVYCVEGADNEGGAWNFILPANANYQVQYEGRLLGGVNTIRFEGRVLSVSPDGQTIQTKNQFIQAIPYCTWNNRGAGEMQVWLPTRFDQLMITAR